MEAFSALLAICVGNSPVTGEFPRKGQWREVWCFRGSAPEHFRRHHTHYDVIVMNQTFQSSWQNQTAPRYFHWALVVAFPKRYKYSKLALWALGKRRSITVWCRYNRSSITWYCIQHNRMMDRIYFLVATRKRHPRSSPSRASYGVYMFRRFERILTAF